MRCENSRQTTRIEPSLSLLANGNCVRIPCCAACCATTLPKIVGQCNDKEIFIITVQRRRGVAVLILVGEDGLPRLGEAIVKLRNGCPFVHVSQRRIVVVQARVNSTEAES